MCVSVSCVCERADGFTQCNAIDRKYWPDLITYLSFLHRINSVTYCTLFHSSNFTLFFVFCFLLFIFLFFYLIVCIHEFNYISSM